MTINKNFVNKLCIQYYGVSFDEYIDETIKPFLNKNKKIKDSRYKLINYYINHSLYDICFEAPIHIETDKILKIIEICSREYIMNTYTDIKENEEEVDQKIFIF